MNDQLEQQLSKVIEKSLALAEKTGDFVIEQAPELLREFYAWHIMENSLYAVVSFIFVVICVFIYRKFSGDKYEDDRDMAEPHVILPMFFSACGGLSGLGFLISFVRNIVFITVAPKLYLIEYFI